ncbi:MAG: thrombospondin type 3 repeat-containing protein [Pseudomonadales bacterium]|nr:thrombospondin type 3 repeat-containing protein [Pseudomonadales bacterium]
MSLILRKIGISLTVCFALINSVIAADWYVSPSGQNWYSGNQAQPFETISKAIQEAQSGDTIYVMDGTYRNSNYNFSKTLGVNPPNLNNQNAVTITKSGLTLKNAPGHSPVIDFDGAGGIKLNGGINDTVIEGFEVIGPSASIDYSQAIANRDSAYNNGDPDNGTNHNYFAGRGIYGFGPHNNITVRNCVVHDTSGSGIRLNDADRSTIEFNRVYNTTWWTHSASSAIVFAETIAESADNGTEVKMIMRGNVVYNNWNRIPFYSRSSVPNGNGPGGSYGTYAQDTIIDGQGLYVTRSDPSYAGTFLFENNITFNNGKNGIHFDHSHSARGIIRNNTIYHNGSTSLVQSEHAEPNKVAGINSRNVTSVSVTNNIVVTRNNQYSAIGIYATDDFQNDGYTLTKVVKNNLFVNGTLTGTTPLDPSNMLNINPEFVNPTTDYDTADFNLGADSPARNAGHSVYVAEKDINNLLRPAGIAASTFESHASGWDAFGDATLSLSSGTGMSGSKSLLVQNRSAAWHGAKFSLTELSLVEGQQYNFVVNAKLASAASGTLQLSMKVGEDGNSFSNLTNPIPADNSSWTELSGSFTYSQDDPVQIYVKGPTDLSGYHLDNAILSAPGSGPVNLSDLVELGVYEYRILSDADSDTIEDSLDNCPNNANADQGDSDQDGIGDVCDPDPDGDGIINIMFNLVPIDKNGDGVINNQDNVFGQDQLEISSDNNLYTVTITATDTANATAKLSRQAAADATLYGLGVRAASQTGPTADRKINEGETVSFQVSDASGPVSVSNFSFVTSTPFPMTETDLAALSIGGTDYGVKGGPSGSVISGSGNVVDGGASWSTVSSPSFSLTPTLGSFRMLSVSFSINTNVALDSDFDGFLDYVDNCPLVANGANEDNQSDIDGDQIGDLCDSDRDGDGVYNDSDAFPDNSAETLDTDNDTHGDNADNCPLISNVDQADVDQDGAGNVCDADADGDGILNTIELAINSNPLDASDGAQAAQDLLDGLVGDEVTVPMMGGLGLITLALSMLGLGVFSRRKQ